MRIRLWSFILLISLSSACGKIDETNTHLKSMDDNTAQMQQQINQMNQQMSQLNSQILQLNQQLAPLAQFGALTTAIQSLATSLSRLETNTSGVIVSIMNLLSSNNARPPEDDLPTADEALAGLNPSPAAPPPGATP